VVGAEDPLLHLQQRRELGPGPERIPRSLAREISQILTLQAAHGDAALVVALERAMEFRRWRADDVRSILAAAGAAPAPRPAGQALVLTFRRFRSGR
jgi:hypothetical protein